MAQAATTSTLPPTQAPCILNPRRSATIIVEVASCCRRRLHRRHPLPSSPRLPLLSSAFFGVSHWRHDEGDGAARRRGRNEEGWQGARRPGPLLALPHRKPSCRLTRCAGSPAAAT
uniref:Uncharacterized protein n=1 Tax=Oryza nivara TaxID=4536 RepID=A0A0E0GZB9_ORYNI